MNDKENDLSEDQAKLKKQLLKLSGELHDQTYKVRDHMFGEIATIVEAVIPEESQAKAIKDLVSNKLYMSRTLEQTIEWQLELLSKAHGFELYGSPKDAQLAVDPINQYADIK